jgi:hypothetical protein
MPHFLETLPIQTARIFEILSSGKFICSLSRMYREEYELLSEIQNYENLQNYFRLLHYELEKEDGYFYFSKLNQDKIEKLSNYVDIFAFFAAMDTKPQVGTRLRPSQIVEELNSNPALQNRLSTMQQKEVREATEYLTKVKALLRELANDFFIEKLSDEQDNYLVLDSFLYLQTIITFIVPYETTT